MQMILAIANVIYCLVAFFIFGQACMLVIRAKNKSVIMTILVGFFAYFSLFQIFAMVFKVARLKLSSLSFLWLIIVIAICIITIIFGRKDISEKFKDSFRVISKNKIWVIVVLAIIAFQLVFIELNGYSGSLMDSSYYMGEIAMNVKTDTISQYDAYTGMQLQRLNSRYFFENYETHSSVVCQLFNIHPIIEVRTVMMAVVIIMHNLIICKIGQNLFKNNYLKTAIMMLFVMIINMFYTSNFSASSFFYNRTYEGKSILANIILPMVILIVTEMVMKKTYKGFWVYLFLVVFSSFGICMSSVFVLPFALVSFFVPLLIIKKRFKEFLPLVICLSLCAVMAVFEKLLMSGAIDILTL